MPSSSHQACPVQPQDWTASQRGPDSSYICVLVGYAGAPVLPIIRHHHEKFNGTGYPDGLKGDAIPLTARVLQIVDVYDALATERPYRKAMSSDEALFTMEDEVKRGWWDADLFRQFAYGVILSGKQPVVNGRLHACA